ncbi:MAG: DUF2807 domain-containing protein [Myxococcota bacterium]
MNRIIIPLAILATACSNEDRYDEVELYGPVDLQVDASQKHREADAFCDRDRDHAELRIVDRVLFVDVSDDSHCTVVVHDRISAVYSNGNRGRVQVSLSGNVDLDTLSGDRVDIDASGDGHARIRDIHADSVRLDTTGDTLIELDHLTTGDLDTSVGGSAELVIGDLVATRWDAYGRGNSVVEASGMVDRLMLDMRGSAVLDASEVMAGHVGGEAGGNAMVTATALDEVTIETTGNAQVDAVLSPVWAE